LYTIYFTISGRTCLVNTVLKIVVYETHSWNVKKMSLCISTDSQLRLMGSTIFTEVPVVFILEIEASGYSSSGNKTLVGAISNYWIQGVCVGFSWRHPYLWEGSLWLNASVMLGSVPCASFNYTLIQLYLAGKFIIYPSTEVTIFLVVLCRINFLKSIVYVLHQQV